MSFADELRALAGAHDDQKNEERVAREAATHEVLREYFTAVRANLQAMLRNAAATGRENVLITRLYEFPVPEEHASRDLAHTMTLNSTRMFVPKLVTDEVRSLVHDGFGGQSKWEIRGSHVRQYITHPTVRELWDDLLGLGLEPYLYVHPEFWQKIDLMVTIPR